MHPDDLEAAEAAGIIDTATRQRLTAFLAARRRPAPVEASGRPFDLTHVFWYAGALIVLTAMGLFSTLAFATLGPGALLATACVYGFGCLACGAILWRRPGLQVPGGLLVAVAVWMAPLAVFSIQRLTGNGPDADVGYQDFHLWIRSGWLPMELSTIVAGLVALVFFPFPFITLMIAVALWFLSMDVVPWIGMSIGPVDNLRAEVSLWFGLGMIAIAYAVDLKRWRHGDFAFWLSLVGLVAFWGGLTWIDEGGDVHGVVYCVVNVCLILVSVFAARRAYAVFGAIGIALYLGRLAYVVFQDSLLFPFALSAIGLLIIGCGLLMHRYGARLTGAIERRMPSGFRALRPVRAR